MSFVQAKHSICFHKNRNILELNSFKGMHKLQFQTQIQNSIQNIITSGIMLEIIVEYRI